MNKKDFFILFIISLIGLFFHFYRLNQSPPCLNADEVAFAYNSYSILKTGKDEFGNFLPVRLISFGDYKMPLLSYFNLPFIALFGLNKNSVKMINALIIFLYTFLIYFFVKKLFQKKKIAFLSSFLFVCSWGVQSFSRQLHEALLTSFLITAAAYFFLLAIEKKNWINELFFVGFLFLALFSYHSSRVYAVFFLFYQLILLFKKRIKVRFFVLTLIAISIFVLTDFIYRPKRVINLLFFNHPGFVEKINDLRKENQSRIIFNKATVATKEIINKYLSYLSPQFLAAEGDKNLRFGNPYLSPLTPVEYIFLLFGFYFLFKNKEKWRNFLSSLFFIAPLSGVFTWTDISLSRTFFILVPSIVLSSYGFIYFLKSFSGITRFFILVFASGSYLFFITFNWYYYLFAYPKNPLNQQAWQCGYEKLVEYVKKNYSKFDQFYISKEGGPPYIFFLFFLNYPPEKFQPQAKLGKVDIYGFQQVEKFDKFTFELSLAKGKKNVLVIGRPWEIPQENAKKILFENNEVFWINEIK